MKRIKHWMAFIYFWFKNGADSRKWPNRPTTINIEMTSSCDSKCIHCPRDKMDRAMQPMPLELFKKLIDQAAEMKVERICPNGFGEIMILKNMGAYLDYISSRKHQFKIIINTNGFRMTEEKIELLIKHKVALLNICIDGATPEVAEAVRVGLKLSQIESNILRLMEIRHQRKLKYPKVRVGFVQIPQNIHEGPSFLEKWKGKVDYVGLDGYSNRVGGLGEKLGGKRSLINIHSTQGTCALPFKELNIWADGKAVLCCNDWNEEHVVGDFNVQSLTEIWHGHGLALARKLHREDRGGEIKICSGCNYWRVPEKGVRLWE